MTSLGTRFALAFALVAAVVAVLVGVLSYRAAADRITAEVDRTLQSTTQSLIEGRDDVLEASPGVTDDADGDGRPGDRGPARSPSAQQRQPVAQTVGTDGTVTFVGGRSVTLPVSAPAGALATARGAGLTAVEEVDIGPDRFRVLTTSLGQARGALQVAIDIDDVRRVLGGMALQVAWVSAAVLLAAAAAGWLLARRITRRLGRLAGIAERVSEDGRAPEPVPVGGRDEVGRLAGAFDTMLVRLAAARDSQERLVQDAAHELRTPLTSLRTNASVLRRIDELPPEARARLVDDLQGETRELSRLVDELVELALARRDDEPEQPVDLAAAAARAADRVRRRTGREVTVDAEPATVTGRRRALERAVGNLLENAAKFDVDGTEPIGLHVHGGTVTVTDRGPGIPADETARVFDRFHRADTARGLPGSGLGLSIVRDVALAHGGGVFARSRPGGGAEVGFSVDPARLLPVSEPGHVEASPGPRTVET